jgi:transposase
VILAEIGLDMTRFPTANHLAAWARLTPQLIQSGNNRRGGKTSKGNPYLKGVLGNAAASASRTNTFLGERYRRIVKRRPVRARWPWLSGLRVVAGSRLPRGL